MLRWIVFAWRNVLRNRRRSLVTAALAALGTAAVLLSSGFALFTYRGLAEDAARNTGHLVVANPMQFLGDEDVPLQHGLDNAEALTRALRAMPQVRQVLPRVEFSGLISNGEKSTVMLGLGIDADAEFAIKGPFVRLVQGEILSNDQRQSVLLGQGLARTLKASPGSALTLLSTTTEGVLNAMDVKVVGVINTGVPDIDLRIVYTPLDLAQKLLVTPRVSQLGVFLDDLEATSAMRDDVAAVAPGLEVRTWESLAPYYQSVRALYNRIFGALGLIIGAIVVFVVVNAMAMAIIERTREVGALRAMGSSSSLLTRLFALEGLFLGGLGALAGAALAFGVAVLLTFSNLQMPAPPGRSVGYPLQIVIDPGLFAATVLAVILLSMLASALVAHRTVSQPIVDALGHT